MLKYFLLWFPMIILAVLNGTARDLGYKKYLGDLTAHQLSTISLIILLWLYISFVIKKFPPASVTQSINIGIAWLLLTLAFEFGFGLYRGKSMNELFADYNLLKGRIWILIPIWTAIAPYIIYRIRLI